MYYNFDEIIVRENTNCSKYDLREQLFGKADIIPLWVADMDFKTPPFIIDALKQRLEHEILGYTYIPRSFNESAAGWIKCRHQWNIEPEWITFAPGVVPALNLLILAFTKPGEKIIVQPPVYFPFFSAIKNHKRVQVNNPLHYANSKYSIDFDNLTTKVDKSTRMFFLCSPHNPGGNVWSPEDLAKIGEFCLANNLILVSDEIHCDLIYKGYKHIPSASLSAEMESITITCMSPSKTFNLAGLSTSYLVISNPELRKRYNQALDHIHVGAGNIFGLSAMEAAYNLGANWVDQLMVYLEENLNFLLDFFHRYLPNIKVIRPQATYLVWLDCRALGMNQQELNEFMIQKAGLGLSDGALFGEEGKGFQRINIACPRSLLKVALTKLKHAVDTHIGK
jgi:cysteine-S-conjugate beta-lyase